jgi:hypothetical protein
MGFEPMMGVLQTLALPLGYVALIFLVGAAIFAQKVVLFFALDPCHEF